MMDVTHRIKSTIGEAILVAEADDDQVSIVVGSTPLLMPRESFDALFDEIPPVEGEIQWACGCPGLDDIMVPRSLIMQCSQDGSSLKECAARHRDNNHPRIYKAIMDSTYQMIGEGLLVTNPFVGRR